MFSPTAHSDGDEQPAEVRKRREKKRSMLLLRKRLYRLMRRTFPSLEYADHETVRRRLSIVYAIVAWQGFALTLYMIFHRKAPKKEEGVDYMKLIATAEKGADSGTLFTLYQGKVARQNITKEGLANIREGPEETLKE